MISLLGIVSGTGMEPQKNKAEKGGVPSAGGNIRLSEMYPKQKNENDTPLPKDIKRHFLEIVSTYNRYQEMMDRKSDLTEVAETLGGIVEAARELALRESDDWFDRHTIKRNMSELDKLGKEFDKFAVEASKLDQRLHSLYEDMGNILSRYYKFGEISEDQMKQRLGLGENKKGCGCNSVNEAKYDWKSEVKVGMKLTDGEGDKYKVIKLNNNSFDVKVLTNRGITLTFPQDFDKDAQIDDWAEYFDIIKGSFKEASKYHAISGDSDYAIGDEIKVNPKEFPGYRFKWGIKGKIIDIDTADYASDDLVLTVKIKYIDAQGDFRDELIIDDWNLIENINLHQYFGIKVNEDGKLQGGADDPCWKGYEMVGMKNVNGKEVPNCVPKK